MFEGLVRQLISGYLGRYIKDIQKEQLKITLWNEEILLENVDLILEAFDYLRLPFAFNKGRVGKLSIKIPWKKLGWDPIIINLEDIYVCISQRDDKEWSTDAVEGREQASKKAKLAAAELAKLSRRVCDNQTGKSFNSYITAKILDGIQVSIRNVHILFHDKLCDMEEILFGLKFSSLTVMRQAALGSSLAKLRGGQVNKLIEVRGLELYSDTSIEADCSDVMDYMEPNNMERKGHKDQMYSSILAPLNVSIALSVNRSGKLLNDAPQYTINVEMDRLVTTIDEVQLRHIFCLCDYISLCELREKYGRYRPWWSPLGKKLNGWQKAWWRYAQESVLFDVRRSLRKTSWKYFGERLNSRRKYVNLYKAKLKCLRYDEIIEEYIQHELEEMEKETDIEDILHCRSIAERELEDFLVNQSSRYGRNGGNFNMSLEDDRVSSKPRGWLNWLSYGMLGAGGTDDSSQFSGVISDDVIKDIYEATKFHPAPAVIEESVTGEICIYSMKISICESLSALRSINLGQGIAEMILKVISIESMGWEKTSTITASVSSNQIFNPISSQLVLSTDKSLRAGINDKVIGQSISVEPECNALQMQQPSLNIRIDLSPPNIGFNSVVKVTIYSTELTCDSEFLKNIVDFLHVLQHMNCQQQRILLSLNGIDDHNSRLLSKIDYVLPRRENMMWDINIFNTIVNIPLQSADSEADNTVVEVGAISATTKSGLDSFASDIEEISHFLTREVGFSSVSGGDILMGFKLQDLYDYFEIQINDAQIKLMTTSSTVHLVESFSCSASLMSCIIPDEPTLKGIEFSLQAPSIVFHFSTSIYREIRRLISTFSMILPPSDSSASLELKSNGTKASLDPWISFTANFGTTYLLVNLEDGVANDYTLSLHGEKLGVWYDSRYFPDCWASVQACQITTGSIQDDWVNHVLCSSGNTRASESVSQHVTGLNLDNNNRHLGDVNLIVDGCILLHFETLSNFGRSLQTCAVSIRDLDIHCYPFVVGKLVRFWDKIVVSEASGTQGQKSDAADDIPSGCGPGVGEYVPSDGIDTCKSPSFQPDHLPYTVLENLRSRCNPEKIDEDMKFQFTEMLRLRDLKIRNLKLCDIERRKKFSAPLVLCNTNADSSPQTSSHSQLFLVNLNLGGVTVHFHDSSCIVCSIEVPLVKVMISVSEDSLDIACSTERVVLSTPWWCPMINEFLWGPSSSSLSQVLNLHIQKDARNPLLILSFNIQHVSCTLPPDFLAVLIGYFSLPGWGSPGKDQSSDTLNTEDSGSVRYNLVVADCNLIVPANVDVSEFLKVNINRMCITFAQNTGSSPVTKEIPSECCNLAEKFSAKNHCLDFLGCDLSLSLLILQKDVPDPVTECQNIILIPSLSGDLWLQIPFDVEPNLGSSFPICIMAMVNDCHLNIGEVFTISGMKGLVYIIDQFSLVGKESEIFTFDVVHFLDAKRKMLDFVEPSPETSNVIPTEMRFCVRSLLVRFQRLNCLSSCSELISEAEMQLFLSLSLISGSLECLNLSFSSLAIFSFLKSTLLAEFACPGPGSPVLEMTLSFSDRGGTRIALCCPFLNVWLHLLEWNEVISLLSSFTNQLSTFNSVASTESMPNIPLENYNCTAEDGPHLIEEANVPSASVCSLLLEHIGLALHFPALVKEESCYKFGNTHKGHWDEFCRVSSNNQNFFLSFNLQCRKGELLTDGNTLKLTITSENLNGMLKLFDIETLQTWPLFQLSKIYLDAEILNYNSTERVSMSLLVRCDSLDVSLSNHMKYLFQFRWFNELEETPSQFIFKRVDFKMHLRKLSILVTDCKWTSNGPLIEFLVRNTNFCSSITEDEVEGSLICDLQVNYYNIDKVLWEPLLEPWMIQLSMNRKQDERALLSGAIMTDINLDSKTPLNLNVNESIIEVASRTIEIIKDAWISMETRNPDLSNSPGRTPEAKRYAPYMVQNLTMLPLLFNVCQQQLGADDLDVSPSEGILEPCSSTPIYINESPDELLFRYRPVQSCDRLSDKQLVDAAHRYVSFQLEGASLPSAPISMDLVGRRYFEVEFSKSSHVSEVYGDANNIQINRKTEGDSGTDGNRGFVVPVVIDVSVQQFTKLIQLYSTVVILNATTLSLEIRLDIPFGLSSKVLGPIYSGQEFPLPLHLAEAGCIRWRPLGDSFLWSEAYNISSIISQNVKTAFLRSFVCYPSHPSNELFRCCISVNGQCLPPVGRVRRIYSPSDVDASKQSQNFHSQSSNSSGIPGNRFLYQVVLSSPLVVKNYLMKSISVTFEVAGGLTRAAFLSEVETSFYQIDSSHDLLITFQMHGFAPSTLKYPRAESFSEKAKFSGTKFSISEIVRFDPVSSDGPLYVTMEKVMDAVSGAREILISVPFLLYNCSGFSLILSNSINEIKGHACIIPSCYELDEKKGLFEKKDGLSLICFDKKSATGFSGETNLISTDLQQSWRRKVTVCLFSPDPSSYSGEVLVKLSRYIPSVVEKFSKRSWSALFSLVPPTGSTSVLVPQPPMASGYAISVSATAAPFPGRTKIITFQPRYVVSNTCTKTLCYKQKGTDLPFVLGAGQHSHIQWMDMNRELSLSVRFDEPGWEWSGCFLPDQLGDTQVKVRNYMTAAVAMMRVEVRSADVAVEEEKIVGSTTGNSGTNLIVLSYDDTGFMPYRIDNHSRERLRIYQPKCESFETMVHPYTSAHYAWDEPCCAHRLVIEVPGERILGSYAIDDTSAESLVHIPATSEKPERNLVISAHSEGAIKVLSVIDSSFHDLDGGKILRVTELKTEQKQTPKHEVFVNYRERISVDIPFLGVSLMNSHPEELLFLSAKNTEINFVQSLDKQQFSLQIASLQIDNQLRRTPYPVILSFNHGKKGSIADQVKVKENNARLISGSDSERASSHLHEPVFSLAVSKWRNTDVSLISFESICLRLADVYLEIEQEIALKLFEFGKTSSSRSESKDFQHIHTSQFVCFSNAEERTSRSAECSGRAEGKYPSCTNTYLLSENCRKSYLLPNIVPIGAPWQKLHLADKKQEKIYIELFVVEPIALTLSFSSSPWILRNGVLTSGESVIHRGLMALADVERAKIHFKQFILSHKIAGWESIQEILVGHYSRQFLHEMYKVFGSAGVIGNPVGFARSLGLGIRDFFSLPVWSVFESPTGLITGMARGTTSLLSNTVYAISDATSQFTKAAHKGIVAFTFDEQTVSMIERQQQGMPSHSKGVINEFLEGLTGLLQSPIKGAEKHGLPGVLSGIAMGVTGLVAKPAASILEVTGITAQSIRNRSRIHQMGYRCFRIRLPRPLSVDSPLKPYSWEDAIGTYVLHETNIKLTGETLIMCKALNQFGQYALITGRFILVVSCSSLTDLGKPNFEGVPADLQWEIHTEIGMDSIILADNEGVVVHIVGSVSDMPFRQSNLQQQKQGTARKNANFVLPISQTNLEFRTPEDADEFLKTLVSMMERRKEQGWASVHILHQSNIK